MLDDLSAIQSRIQEIQGRFRPERTPPAAPAHGLPEPGSAQTTTPPSFAATLHQAQEGRRAVGRPARAARPSRSARCRRCRSPRPRPSVVPIHAADAGGYDGLIQTYAAKHGLAPELVRAVIHTESRRQPAGGLAGRRDGADAAHAGQRQGGRHHRPVRPGAEHRRRHQAAVGPDADVSRRRGPGAGRATTPARATSANTAASRRSPRRRTTSARSAPRWGRVNTDESCWRVFGLLAVLGIVYGLAFVGIIPTQKLAAKSPALGKALIALHLAKPDAEGRPAAAATPAAKAPPRAAGTGRREAADRGRSGRSWTRTRPRWTPSSSRRSPPRPGHAAPPAPDTGAKLIALYGTMAPDDLAPHLRQAARPVRDQDADADGREKGRQGPRRPAARSRRPPQRDHDVSRAVHAASTAAAPAPVSVIQ